MYAFYQDSTSFLGNRAKIIVIRVEYFGNPNGFIWPVVIQMTSVAGLSALEQFDQYNL